ncbi:MAG: stage II sporulation protein M, partial [Turicibacter sp.]
MVAQKRRKKSFSYVLYVMYVLLLLVIIGDIIGSSLYIKLEQSSQSLMVNYVNENINAFDQTQWSFNQLFYKQFMYQGSMWVLGLTVIGVVVNLFLVFLKGVIAGFNVFFIFQTLAPMQAIWTSFLWLIQYSLILGVTILSGYFSVRFVIMAVKIIFFKKNTTLLKKHLLYY